MQILIGKEICVNVPIQFTPKPTITILNGCKHMQVCKLPCKHAWDFHFSSSCIVCKSRYWLLSSHKGQLQINPLCNVSFNYWFVPCEGCLNKRELFTIVSAQRQVRNHSLSSKQLVIKHNVRHLNTLHVHIITKNFKKDFNN